MQLTIIVPFYNAEKYLKRCITSLINQDLKADNYEIILINDGSTDNGVEVVEDFLRNNKNIFLYNQENQGLGATRNNGVKFAKGDYIYFIDADDYIAVNTLGTLLTYSKELNLELLGFNTTVTEKADLFTSNNIDKKYETNILKGTDFLVKYKYHRLEAWWYIIKRDFLLKTECKFEEGKFMEDAIFTFNIFLAANRTMFLPMDVHRYVKVQDSIMNNSEKGHLLQVIRDYVDLVFRFHSLSVEVAENKDVNSSKIVDSINYKSTVSIYFMFFRLIKSELTIKEINKILNKLKSINMYPLKNFIGEQYFHKKFKITAFIFNHKYVFFILLYPLRILYKFKLINLL